MSRSLARPSMARRSLSAALATLTLSSALLAEEPYVLGGPAASLAPASGSYTWDGSQLSAFRAALEDPRYFGPNGTVSVEIQTRDLITITEDRLRSLDGFIAPFWEEVDQNDHQLDLIIEFFLAGGDLFVLADTAAHDALAQRLGLGVTGTVDDSTMTGFAPLCDGPFGPAGTVSLYGRRAEFSRSRTRTAHGVLGGVTPGGELPAVWFNRGAFGPRCGALVLVGDVSIPTIGNFDSLNANARFCLNTAAFLARREVVAVMGGPDASLTPQSADFAWDGGAHIADYRQALEDDARFGQDGTVGVKVHTEDLSVVDRDHLAMLTHFCVPNWYDTDSDAQAVSDVAAYFWYERGNLLLCADGTAFDDLPDSMGLPVQNGASRDEGLPLGTLSDGPFGLAPKVSFEGSYGHFDRSVLESKSGMGLGYTLEGDNVIAWFGAGDFQGLPVSGSMLLLSDVDVLSSREADYDAMNWNAICALNATAHSLTARPYRLVGPDATISGIRNSWDGPNMADFRAAVEDHGHFGPLGMVRQQVHTDSTRDFSPVHLAKYDGFATGLAIDGTYTQDQRDAIEAFFKRGGSLLAAQEGSDTDAIAGTLGLYAFGANLDPNIGDAPLFEGPFGSVHHIESWGSTSSLDLSSILARGGNEGSRNFHDEVQSAWWAPGEFGAGSGAMVILGDSDFMASDNQNIVDYAPLNDNARFALNAMSLLVESRCEGHGVHYGRGLAGSGGITPTLDLSGCAQLGTKVELSVENGLGRAPMMLMVGLSGREDLDFNGTPLVVRPPWILLRSTLNGTAGLPGDGSRTFFARLPQEEGLVGTQVNLQALVADPSAASGLAATCGLEFIIVVD